jgi:hypothetical protein
MDTSPVVQVFPLSVAESPIHCVKQCFVTVHSTRRRGAQTLCELVLLNSQASGAIFCQEVLRAYEQRTPTHQHHG